MVYLRRPRKKFRGQCNSSGRRSASVHRTTPEHERPARSTRTFIKRLLSERTLRTWKSTRSWEQPQEPKRHFRSMYSSSRGVTNKHSYDEFTHQVSVWMELNNKNTRKSTCTPRIHIYRRCLAYIYVHKLSLRSGMSI